MVVENASTNITSFDEQIQALSWDSRCFRRRLFYDDRRKWFFYDDRRKSKLLVEIHVVSASGPSTMTIGVCTTRQPYALRHR